jgi:hypothetical protein
MSCEKSNDIKKIDLIKENAECQIKRNVNDPSGYEFISIGENIFKDSNVSIFYHLKNNPSNMNPERELYFEGLKKQYLEDYYISDDDIIMSFNCRNTNEFNALIKEQYLVVCNKDSVFINMFKLN